MRKETQQQKNPTKLVNISSKIYQWKMFNITSCSGNANQNCNEIAIHTDQDDCYQRQKISVGKNAEKLELCELMVGM